MACFRAFDCRVTILFEAAMLSSAPRRRRPCGFWDSADCRMLLRPRLLQVHYAVATCASGGFCAESVEKKNSHACKDKHHLASRPPAHPRHMLTVSGFQVLRPQTSDWSQQASEGSLFTSPQQVNILHLASSSWKSERCEGELSSFMTANSVCVCMNEAKK